MKQYLILKNEEFLFLKLLMSKFYRNCAVVFGIIFFIQAFRWTLSLQSFLIVCGVNAALVIVFWIASAFSKRITAVFPNVLISVITILLFFVWLGFTFANETVGRMTTMVTNPYFYERILKPLSVSSHELLSHFPKTIPKKVKGIRFAFIPGFLQGATVIQLRYATTSEEIDKLYERFLPMMQKIYWGGDTNDHMNERDGMPTTFFYTDGVRSFPKDYEIMTFDPILKKEDRSQGFNHGQSHGVAISKLRNEIVYWAESW